MVTPSRHILYIAWYDYHRQNIHTQDGISVIVGSRWYVSDRNNCVLCASTIYMLIIMWLQYDLSPVLVQTLKKHASLAQLLARHVAALLTRP